MSRSTAAALLLLGLLPVAAGAGAELETPLAVSPGSAHQLSLIESRCPTFIWGRTEGALTYELAVYQVGETPQQPRVALRKTLPGSVSAWTPALGSCMEPGVQYAWSVRATAEQGESEWSPPALFRVAGGPVRAPSLRSAEPPAPQPLAAPQLTVTGGVVGTSFSGSGAGLTDLTEPICDLHARTDLPFPPALSCPCRELQERCGLTQHCCGPTLCVGQGCCAPLSENCSSSADCCGSLSCVSGSCCAGLGDPCGVPTDCCGILSCFGGSCCQLPGQPCSSSADCCEGFCQEGSCSLL